MATESEDVGSICPRWTCLFCRETTSNMKCVLTCHRCSVKCHTVCLYNRGLQNQGESWFCSPQCAALSLSLDELEGKSISVGAATDNLKWNWLSINRESSMLGGVYVALREAFDKDAAQRVVSGIGVYSRFTAAVIIGEHEVLSTAIVRVHREAVEVAYVATRRHVQRRGLARLLMKELERQMMSLGVRYVILHSTFHRFETWKNSFGFQSVSNELLLRLAPIL